MPALISAGIRPLRPQLDGHKRIYEAPRDRRADRKGRILHKPVGTQAEGDRQRDEWRAGPIRG